MEKPSNPYYWSQLPGDPSSWNYLMKTPGYYLKGIYRQIMTKNVFLWGQAIAFKVLIATVPVIVLATGILSYISIYLPTGQEAFGEVAKFLHDFLAPYKRDYFIKILRELQSAGGTFTIIGAIGLFFSAMTLFTTLRLVIDNVFEEEWNEKRSLLGGYAFDIRMVIQVGLLFVMAMSISTLNASGWGWKLLSEAGLDYMWLRQGWRRTLEIVTLLVPFLLLIAMFFQLFYFTPKPHPPKRCALKGALVTAALWEIAKQAFYFYASHAAGFERYSSDNLGSVTGLGNVFGLLLAFVIWAYFSGVVLVIGATVSVLSEKRYRAHRRAQRAEQQEAQVDPSGYAEDTNGVENTTAEDAAAQAEARKQRREEHKAAQESTSVK